MPVTIADKLSRVRQRLADAAAEAGRPAGEITLIAVSKTQAAAAIAEAYAAGQRRFGENYLQEALDKQAELTELADLEWHFLGPIQSNKTRAVAEHFSWVHSLDRLKIARRLSDQRPPSLGPVNVCIQVNIDSEASKSGVSPDTLPDLAREVDSLPGLSLRGLMAIPAPTDDRARTRASFAALSASLQALRKLGLTGPLDTLSMGMSADLEAAVAEGATCVRIGTDIFGPRTP